MLVPSSDCCQPTCIRDLNKKGTKKGECKAQCDYLFFNELVVCVGRGKCVCFFVCLCVCVFFPAVCVKANGYI